VVYETLAAAAAAPDAGPLRRSILAPLADAVAAVIAARDADRIGELCLAAGRNDVLSLRRALAAGASVNACDYDGRAALHVAAAKGADAAVRYLLDHGAHVNVTDSFGNTPLFEAVASAHATSAAMLRSAGAELGLRDAHAFADGEEEIAPSAVSVARRGRDSGTLMCSVAASGDASFLSALLRNGLPAGAADYDGRTGLHLAAALGRVQLLTELLDAGADASARDNFGRTPLLEAVRAGHEGTATLLLSRGASLGLLDGRDSVRHGDLLAGSEMCQAASSGDVDYLRRLLRAGVHPDSADYDSRTAAHLACSEGLLHVALALHAAGADFAAKDRWGHTPLDEAEAQGHAQLAATLRSLPHLLPQPRSLLPASPAAPAVASLEGSAASREDVSIAGSAGAMQEEEANAQPPGEEGYVEGLTARSDNQPDPLSLVGTWLARQAQDEAAAER